jgi:outer membrane protein OmpA-like peptidoglycan-associated protein
MRKAIFVLGFFLSLGEFFSQQQEYLYKNDFTDRLINDKMQEDESKIIRMKDGYLYFEQLKETYGWYMAERIFIDQDQDFEISAKIKPYNYNSECEFGLVFGLKNVEANNTFVMHAGGAVRIGNRVLDHYTPMYVGSKPEIISADRWYLFKIVHKDKKFFFYVNDVLVYERKNFDMMGRWFGWYTFGKMGIQIDYFYVKQKRGTIKLAAEGKDMKKEHLTGGINTERDETNPVLSKDFKSLYFKRILNKKNDFSFDDGDPLLMKCLTDSTLKVEATGKVKMNYGFASPWYIASVPDGNGFYTGEKSNLKALSGSGISFLEETTGQPDYNRNIKFSGGNSITIRHACIADNRKVMLMEGFGNYEPWGKDLYVSFLEGDSWSQPKKISALCTKGDETAPFISKDMKKIYFSSDGHPGYGFSDVFVTTRLDETWMNWSEPQNLGPGVNDAANNDAFMMPDTGKYAFMSSNYSNINNLDIFRVNVVKPPEEVLMLKGKIIYTDGIPHDIRKVKVAFKKKNLPAEFADVEKKDDQFALQLKKDEPFTVQLLDTNYIITEQKDFTTIGKTKERKVEIRVTRITRGETFVLENIYFVPNKTELLASSFPSLDQLLSALKNNPRLKIEVQGHTSKTNEGEKFNMELSNSRAIAVKDYLVSKGIPASRLQAKGYGYSKPIYTDSEEEHQAKNRRVEIKILEK